MLPRTGAISVLLGLLAGILGSFFLASFFLKIDKNEEESDMSLSDDIGEMLGVSSKSKSKEKGYKTEEIKKIIFACDAGVGSSAMGSGILKKKIKDANLPIEVTNMAVDTVPKDTKVIITHKNLKERACAVAPNAVVRTVNSFLNDPEYDRIIKDLLEGEVK